MASYRVILLAGVSVMAVGAASSAFAQSSSVRAELEALRAQVAASQAALEQALERIDQLESQQDEVQEQVAALPATQVRAGRGNVDLEVYGHINQAIRFADNGNESQINIVDNDNSGSRIGVRGRYRNGMLSAGVRAELGFEVNSSDEISFSDDGVIGDEAGEADFLDVRHADTFVAHERFGTLSLGFGPTATEGVSETDLSGTTLISESDVDDIGGNLEFGNDDTPILGSEFQVDSLFANLDGERTTRIGYASPRFEGIQGVFSLRVDDDDDGDTTLQPDASVNWEGELFGWETEAQAGYRRESDADVFIGSMSTLADFGTNFTLGGGVSLNEDDGGVDTPNENFVFVKVGQQLELFDFGDTNLSVDFFRGEDNSVLSADGEDNTEGFSVGAGFVQEVPEIGTEFYAAGRVYFVDAADGTDTDPLFVLFSGARVRF